MIDGFPQGFPETITKFYRYFEKKFMPSIRFSATDLKTNLSTK